MDGTRFDALARALADGCSRRGLVDALTAAAGLAAADGALADKDTGGRDGGREHGRNRGALQRRRQLPFRQPPGLRLRVRRRPARLVTEWRRRQAPPDLRTG